MLHFIAITPSEWGSPTVAKPAISSTVSPLDALRGKEGAQLSGRGLAVHDLPHDGSRVLHAKGAALGGKTRNTVSSDREMSSYNPRLEFYFVCDILTVFLRFEHI